MTRIGVVSVSLFMLFFASAAQADEIIFQEGAEVTVDAVGTGDFYSGTHDNVVLSGNESTTNFGGLNLIIIDSSAGGRINHAAIRFDDIIGAAASQIPASSVVSSATLDLWIFDGTAADMSYGTLNGTWDENVVVWDTFLLNGNASGGIQFDGTEGSLLGTIPSGIAAPVSIDVQTEVQAWVNGGGNFGWGLLPNSADGCQIRTAEYATVGERPRLTVNYVGGATTTTTSTTSTTTTTTTTTIPVCGEGVVNGLEECDDGGTSGGDGCSGLCTIEQCYACSGEPSSCAADTGASCDDDLPCTENDVCDGQADCAGTPKDCSGLDDQCNDGVCNPGTGVCEASPVQDATGCDDGLFCTATDVCTGGQCGGSGDPCTVGDQCSDACNETDDDCFDDAGTVCDDLNVCTVDDQCDGAGFCGATDTLFGSACEWFGLTASDRTAKLIQKRDVTIVGGGLCADRSKIGQSNDIDGDLAATEDSNDRALHIFPSVVVAGDIVTGGGGVTGGANARLPHLDANTTFIDGGEQIPKDAPATGEYNTIGDSAVLLNCVQSQTEALAAADTIAGLSADQDLGRVELLPGETLNVVAPNVGGFNVIDFERLTSAVGATINVDASGNADTIVILRIERKLQLKAQSSINMTNGMDPANFVAFVTGKKLQLGNKCTASGTLYAAGLVKIDSQSVINGQVFAAGKKLQIGEGVVGTTIPNLIVLP